MKQRKPGPKANDLAWIYLIARPPHNDRRGGTLKIGVTSRPKARMQSHRQNLPYTRFHFCASGPRVLMLEAEQACLRAFARIGKRLHPLGEDFYGVEFDAAVLLVRENVLRLRGSLPELAELTAKRAEMRDGSAAWRLFRARLLAEAV